MPMNPQIPPGPRTIEILAYPGVQPLDVTGPLQVFASANDLEMMAGRSAPYVVRMLILARRLCVTSCMLLGIEDTPSVFEGRRDFSA